MKELKKKIKLRTYFIKYDLILSLFPQNPFVRGNKSYSTSTGGEMRELEDLSEIPSDYRDLREGSDSESDYR